MIKQCVRNAARAVTLMCALVAASSCGGVLYAVSSASAASKIEEAKALGAEERAPYEYYSAQEYMKKAMDEAAQADYGDADDLAEQAEKFAQKAINLSRQAYRGAGR